MYISITRQSAETFCLQVLPGALFLSLFLPSTLFSFGLRQKSGADGGGLGCLKSLIQRLEVVASNPKSCYDAARLTEPDAPFLLVLVLRLLSAPPLVGTLAPSVNELCD